MNDKATIKDTPTMSRAIWTLVIAAIQNPHARRRPHFVVCAVRVIRAIELPEKTVRAVEQQTFTPWVVKPDFHHRSPLRQMPEKPSMFGLRGALIQLL